MRRILLPLLFILPVTAFAQYYPHPYPYPRPTPTRYYTCHALMKDRWNRDLYYTWGTATNYNVACNYAMRLCRQTLPYYRGYGARCVLWGR